MHDERKTHQAKRKLSFKSSSAPKKPHVTKVVAIQRAQASDKHFEKKYYDVGITTTVASTTGSVTEVFQPTEGTDANNRVGREVEAISLHLMGYFQIPETVNAATQQVAEIAVFWDNESLGATPAASTFFQGGVINPLSFPDVDAAERYICLGRSRYTLANTAAGGASTAPVSIGDGTDRDGQWFERFIKLKRKVRFLTGSNVPQTGALIVLITSDVAAASSQISVKWNCRVRFQDA